VRASAANATHLSFIKGRDGQKPVLASAENTTSIVHKQAGDTGTPYEQVNNIEMPKFKPVNQASHVSIAVPVPERHEPDAYDPNDLQELRHALVMCFDIGGRLEWAREWMVYRSVGTQAWASGPRAEREAPKRASPLDVTEVTFSDESQSPPANRPQQAERRAQDLNACPRARKARAPRTGNADPSPKHEQQRRQRQQKTEPSDANA
jgi:hypothetical protein